MLKMIWLMDYAKFWKDKNNTFCDSIKTNSTFLANVNRDSFAPLDHPLMKFLALTKEITESCPNQCQCNIARTTIESKNKLHLVHFLLRLFIIKGHCNFNLGDAGLFWKKSDRITK